MNPKKQGAQAAALTVNRLLYEKGAISKQVYQNAEQRLIKQPLPKEGGVWKPSN